MQSKIHPARKSAKLSLRILQNRPLRRQRETTLRTVNGAVGLHNRHWTRILVQAKHGARGLLLFVGPEHEIDEPFPAHDFIH
jgi:hypothetical protein